MRSLQSESFKRIEVATTNRVGFVSDAAITSCSSTLTSVTLNQQKVIVRLIKSVHRLTRPHVNRTFWHFPRLRGTELRSHNLEHVFELRQRML